MDSSNPRVYPLTFSSGLFTAKHRKRMGASIWVFGYLVDRITKEEEENEDRWVGIVSGGAPVKAADIADHLDLDEWTTRSHLKHLEEESYIRRRRTPRGYAVEILNSKKWAFWKAGRDRGKTPGHKKSDRGFSSVRPGEPPRSNKTYQYISDKNMSANAEVTAVVDAYRQHIRPNARLTDSTRKKIQTRLKTYTLDELIHAIQNFSANIWWMDNNGHRGMAWFFHNDDRIDGFLAMNGRSDTLECPMCHKAGTPCGDDRARCPNEHEWKV